MQRTSRIARQIPIRIAAFGMFLLVATALVGGTSHRHIISPAHAQSVPPACNANSPECIAISNTDPACVPQWQGKRCSNVPCAYRDSCGCGACLDGCNAACKPAAPVVTSPPSGGTSTGSNTGTATTPGGTSTGTSAGNVPQKVPLSTECANRCDLNKDGMITKADFSNTKDTSNLQQTIQYCLQSCPWADGTDRANQNPLPSGAIPGNPAPSGTQPGGPLEGDCSGSTPGVPDGKVDLQDVEHFRQELNKERSTKACDFDKSGEVDVIDFTNYLRTGYIRSN